jgi:hypothetical protein
MSHYATPWGRSDNEKALVWGTNEYEQMFPIVELVGTPSHGGIGVLKKAADQLLSKEARDKALDGGDWLWFEEDCDMSIPLYEIQTARDAYFAGANPEGNYATEEQRMESLLTSLSNWNAPYLKARGISPDPVALAQFEQREEDARRRAAKDPDLVVWAEGHPARKGEPPIPPGAVRVGTADGKSHLVVSADYQARTGLNLLSKYRPFSADMNIEKQQELATFILASRNDGSATLELVARKADQLAELVLAMHGVAS